MDDSSEPVASVSCGAVQVLVEQKGGDHEDLNYCVGCSSVYDAVKTAPGVYMAYEVRPQTCPCQCDQWEMRPVGKAFFEIGRLFKFMSALGCLLYRKAYGYGAVGRAFRCLTS